MVDKIKAETPIATPETGGLENIIKTATGEVSEDILALKKEIAKKYIEELKENKDI